MGGSCHGVIINSRSNFPEIHPKTTVFLPGNHRAWWGLFHMASIENGSWGTPKVVFSAKVWSRKMGENWLTEIEISVSTTWMDPIFRKGVFVRPHFGENIANMTMLTFIRMMKIFYDFIRFPCMQSYIYPEWNIWSLFQDDLDVSKSVRRLAVCFLWRDRIILMFTVGPKLVVPQNGWFVMENLIKMDDLGVPYFRKHPDSDHNAPFTIVDQPSCLVILRCRCLVDFLMALRGRTLRIRCVNHVRSCCLQSCDYPMGFSMTCISKNSVPNPREMSKWEKVSWFFELFCFFWAVKTCKAVIRSHYHYKL